MSKVCKIILQGKPISTNNMYSRVGDKTSITPKARQLQLCYLSQIEKQYKDKMLRSRLSINLYLFLPDRSKGDIDNYNKLILDCLSGIVYNDDKQIINLNIYKMYDRKNPRAEVFITEI